MERLSNNYATTSIYMNTHQRAVTVYLDLIYRHRNAFDSFSRNTFLPFAIIPVFWQKKIKADVKEN